MRRFVLAAGLCSILGVALAWAADDKQADKKDSDKKWTFVDLQPKANQKLTETMSPNRADNDLAGLKAGEQTLEGVKFKIGAKLIILGSTQLPKLPKKVEGIAVDRKFAKLHLLHATQWYDNDEDAIIGEYVVTWEDDSSVTIPVVYGKDIRDWWYYEDTPEPTRGKVAWKGENEAAKALNAKVRLYLTTWENPKPEKKVKTIDMVATKEGTAAALFCVAMTAEEE
jgi:hypothetical protein